MYDIALDDLLIVSDSHPQYASSEFAKTLPARTHREVQHHRAHVASVLAERGAFDERVLGVALDGTGYGDDGTIWGGEFFAGSVHEGFRRVAHLRPAMLPGGDAAARYPVQAAAGFLSASFERPHDLRQALGFLDRYAQALELIAKQVRIFQTTSTGRLFDAAAAITGFTGAVSYEAQGAIWFEQLARRSTSTAHYRLAFDGRGLDWRPLLCEMVRDVRSGTDMADVARAFHRGFARGLAEAIESLCAIHGLASVALSGGVFQNELLMSDLIAFLAGRIRVWTNAAVPCNDGGLSLGQAALGACMCD